MNLLALDTSSVACSVAVTAGGKVFFRHEEQPREHTRLLMPMIRDLLAESGTALADLDGIVLGNGPGSFIGMRIGASVAQGLAYAAGIKIVPVSSMAAVALRAADGGGLVAVTQDAHMNEVYLGLYDVDRNRLVSAVRPECLQAQMAIPELENLPSCIAAGHGWQRYPALLEANRDRISAISKVMYPDARDLLVLGEAAYADAIAPEAVMPAYLRQEIARKPTPNRP